MRLNSKKRNASNKAKRTYLLSGLIECTECGSTYIGHASKNQRGCEIRYYICDNKYRTHACKVKNINANVIETFVVQPLKAYLLNVDFDRLAREIADRVNSASPDLSAEKRTAPDILKNPKRHERYSGRLGFHGTQRRNFPLKSKKAGMGGYYFQKSIQKK